MFDIEIFLISWNVSLIKERVYKIYMTDWTKIATKWKWKNQVTCWFNSSVAFACCTTRSNCTIRQEYKQVVCTEGNNKFVFHSKQSVLGYMVKRLSAHGGCLGGRRRWRTWQSAISFGELTNKLWSGDFRMGKPDHFGGHHYLNT